MKLQKITVLKHNCEQFGVDMSESHNTQSSLPAVTRNADHCKLSHRSMA